MISISRWLSLGLRAAVAASMLAMMLLTVADVVGRYFFNSPLRGSGEMIGFLMGLTLMCAMPMASAAGRHIAVSLLDERAGPALRVVLRVVIEALSAASAALIAVAMAFRHAYLVETGERTQILQLLLWPSALLIAVLWVAVSIAHLAAMFSPHTPRGDVAGTT